MSADSSPPSPQPPSAAALDPRGSVWRVPGILALTLLSVTGFGGFAALFSVVPLWAVHGGVGSAGSGLVTGVLLLSTILTQTVVPTLLRVFGYSVVLCASALALGLPSLAFGLSDGLTPILLLSAVRGVGFGILTVTGSTVVAELVPIARRGEAVGIYGLGIAVPNVVLLPASVAIADRLGFWWVFGLGAVPLLGIPAALRLGRAVRARSSSTPPQVDRTSPAPVERRPWRAVVAQTVPPSLILFAVTLASGALMTFLPQVTHSSEESVAALLVLGVFSALSRWLVGRVGDRHGAHRLLAPLLAITAAGLVATGVFLSGAGGAWLLMPAVGAVGLGYGALQNVTLVTAFSRVTSAEYGGASAVWNIGFDSGTGCGAVLVGLVAAAWGFPAGFFILAGLALVALPLSRVRPGSDSGL
ncbi:MAG: MFS transporter [Nocardioidaceae bacterium]